MKEAVNEEHAGKRKHELNWKVHRIHWEKNRFIYDLKYVRKAISQDLVRRRQPQRSPPALPALGSRPRPRSTTTWSGRR